MFVPKQPPLVPRHHRRSGHEHVCQRSETEKSQLSLWCTSRDYDKLMRFVNLSLFLSFSLSVSLSLSLCLSLCVYCIFLLKRLLSHTPRTCMGLSSLTQTRKVSITPLERSVETFALSCKAIIRISLRKYPISWRRRTVAFMTLKGNGRKTLARA